VVAAVSTWLVGFAGVRLIGASGVQPVKSHAAKEIAATDKWIGFIPIT
jgi:hypothetical protein